MVRTLLRRTSMRFVRRLLGAALLGAGVLYLRGRRKARAIARRAEESFDESVDEAMETSYDDPFGTSVPNEADLIEVVS